jgi:trimeric autotransporter adhesin
MRFMRIRKWAVAICAMVCLMACSAALAREYKGQVTFGGVPVPGATVTVTQGDKKFTAVTDQQGVFTFADLPDGAWKIEIEMQGFAPLTGDAFVAANAPPAPPWELKMLALDEIKAAPVAPLPPVAATATATAAAPAPSNEPEKPAENGKEQPKQQPQAAQATPGQPQAPPTGQEESANDGFLINGSSNNGAASPFAQLAAFGNNRGSGKGLYNGGIGVIVDDSVLNANAYSISGQQTPKPSYSQITGVVNIGGPLRIPHIFRANNAPTFFVGYQWTRNGNDTTVPALVPTLAERQGNFANAVNAQGQPLVIINPATGLPFPGNMVPVSTQAAALLNLYPMPNVAGNPLYNYQAPIITNLHQDALQSRITKTIGRKDNVFGGFAFQDSRTSSPNIFNFLDTTDALGLNANVNWVHRFGLHWIQNLGFRYNRLATTLTPFWENRENISGLAGITGNNQDPMNWGPPALGFSSGVVGLSDGLASHDRNQTTSVSDSTLWIHRTHFVTFGGDYRRQEFNYLSQQNPRGTFTFTGAATSNGTPGSGSDLADFLLGIPDTSAIAFGNADKYFRENVYDAFITDDWRITPQLSLNNGLRWEYGAPITELDNRLVNLDIAQGFTAVAPVVANNPVGPLTGTTYPNSLLKPDRHGVEPRLALSWRPISGDSMVVRAGYGINYDTSVYQNIALQMAQQAPLSTSLSVQNTAACPLTLANGFRNCGTSTPDLFAVDPNFHVGYLQTWRVDVQRDLPASLVLTVSYIGMKGTRGMQEFLPNTYPIGATNPCPTCPSGFVYLTSNGDSTREAGQVQLRRRLHNGLVAQLQYTYSKSIDDDSMLGGQGALATAQTSPSAIGGAAAIASGSASQGAATIAQNWLNLTGERGLSWFDQRHLGNAQLQYTTGMGLGGKSLMSGWRGRLYKEWTLVTNITVGTGFPQTPVYLAAVPGTGVTGTIRPDVTGAPIYSAPTGLYLNPAAYTPPAPGQWGNAGRDSITGPGEFTLDGSIARTFRLNDRFNLDLRFDASNLLNHVTYTSWNVLVGSPIFGLPAAANQMRIVRTTLRVRF